MKITKFGHSCVLLDDGHTKILFDPGAYNDVPANIEPDAIVITHIHQDHVDINKFADLFKKTPRIITNTEVKKELAKHNINTEIVEDGGSAEIGSMKIEAFGNDHAVIHPDGPKFQNTGYLVNGAIYHPGDALHKPDMQPKILLLPIVAPWSKISDTLDYMVDLHAPVNFPIHDGFLKDPSGSPYYGLTKAWCEKNNLEFIDPELNKEYEFSV